jgi:hypothetical protein
MESLISGSPVRERGIRRAGHPEDAVSQVLPRLGGDALALPHTDWLRHELVVIGTSEAIAEFRQAACGSGGIPWAYPDLDYEEDDRYLALVNPPDGSLGLSPAAARVLAHELREAEFQHQRKVRALAGFSRLCPLDLHALVPIPPDLLDLGPDDNGTVAWLRAHWGVLQALRNVALVPAGCKKLRGKKEQITLEFWSADWTPWPTIAAIRKRFASLIFTVTPDYGGG